MQWAAWPGRVSDVFYPNDERYEDEKETGASIISAAVLPLMLSGLFLTGKLREIVIKSRPRTSCRHDKAFTDLLEFFKLLNISKMNDWSLANEQIY